MTFFAILAGSIGLFFSDSSSTLPQDWRTIQGARADSAWNIEKWSVAAAIHTGLVFGESWSTENDMARRTGLGTSQSGSTVRIDMSKSVVMLEAYGFDLAGWRTTLSNLDAGLGFSHDWVLAHNGGTDYGLLLSSNALVARARWFPFRRLIWEIGPQIGGGLLWGTLTRFPLEQDQIRTSAGTVTANILRIGNSARSLTGYRVQMGGTMEIRLPSRITIGEAILLTRDCWTMQGADPLATADASGDRDTPPIDYGTSPVDYEIGFSTQAAFRF